MPARVATALGYESRQVFLDAYRATTTAVRESWEHGIESRSTTGPGNTEPGAAKSDQPGSRTANPGSRNTTQ